jgi:hypothetical protein
MDVWFPEWILGVGSPLVGEQVLEELLWIGCFHWPIAQDESAERECFKEIVT